MNQVYTLLSETPPKGAMFAKCIKHILAREEHWNNWKNDGCQEFKRPAVPNTDNSEDVPEKRPRVKSRKDQPYLGDLVREAAASNSFVMGK